MLSTGEITLAHCTPCPALAISVGCECRNHRPGSSLLEAQCLLGGGKALGPKFKGPHVFTPGPPITSLTVSSLTVSPVTVTTVLPLLCLSFLTCQRGLASYLPHGVVCGRNELVGASLLAHCLTQNQYFLLLYLLFILLPLKTRPLHRSRFKDILYEMGVTLRVA